MGLLALSSFSGALQCRCKRPTLAPAHASNKPWHLPYNPPRSLTDDVRRQAPKWQDLAAERVQLEGGADGWRFTKSHTVYQQDLVEHAKQQQKLDALLHLLLPCLVLALPRAGGSSCCFGQGAAPQGEEPPAKVPRLA